jgi:Holliday junction resolvase RusA-like endonuclease
MHIWVSGDPAPQGSVNAFALKKGGQYTGRVGMRSASSAHASWRNDVARAAAEELKRAGLTLADLPLFGADWACSVEIRFYLPRPKSHFGTGRNAGQIKPQFATVWPMVKDFDKLTRTILDALQLAGVVADDKQFVGTPGIWRIYADYCVPGADIWVEPAPPGIPALALMPGLRRRDGFGSSNAAGRALVDFKTGQILVSGEGE